MAKKLSINYRKILSLFFIFLFLFVTPAKALTNSWIYDKEDDRVILLHGLNISNAAKKSDDKLSWHNYSDYERMRKEWGFNAIRLLIFWEAVEPEPGVFNETYLDKVVERIEWAQELGIYVIVDMHQDLYSSKYGSNGAPHWACWDNNIPYNQLNPWFLNYLTPAVRRAFTNFWLKDYLNDHFTSSWLKVVERVKDIPNVLGYDIINEPVPGNIPPFIFDRFVLKNFYIDIISKIREKDTDNLIFYEPSGYTYIGFKNRLGILPYDNLVFAPHFYLFFVHENKPYTGNSFPINRSLSSYKKTAEKANVPWIVGEFGTGEEIGGMDQYLIDHFKIFNSKFVGWTCWAYDRDTQNEYGIINETGEENKQLSYLVHPYPQKTSGTPLNFSYDFDSRVFTFEFNQNASINNPTEIFIGDTRIYPEGYIVGSSEQNDIWEYDSEYKILNIWADKNVEYHKITIEPKIERVS